MFAVPPLSDFTALSRRRALKLLAAQTAAITLAACSRPSEEIVPYVRMPEGYTPGVPMQFATTLPLGGFGRGVICKSVEGRPIKVEGNPAHPAKSWRDRRLRRSRGAVAL